jgi:hypothetical protein
MEEQPENRAKKRVASSRGKYFRRKLMELEWMEVGADRKREKGRREERQV